MEIFVVVSVSTDGYIDADSAHTDYGNALERANELENKGDSEWEVISCKLEYSYCP